jgi:acyl-CoA thioesterase
MDAATADSNLAAEAVGRAMMAGDAASRALGIVLETIRPGFARARMQVRSDMVNGHGRCHGGLIFTLADTAFACACNSRNAKSVAHVAQINFIAAAQVGEILTAEAGEVSATGRTGIYDVTVRRGDGEIVALFRGNSYRIKGEVVSDLNKQP